MTLADSTRASAHDFAAGRSAQVAELLREADSLIGIDPQRMESVSRDALRMARQAKDPLLQAFAEMKLGDSLRFQRRHATAIKHFDTARRLFLRLGRPVEAARTRIGWARVTAALNKQEEALAVIRQARRVLVANGELSRVAALDNITGNIHLDQGREHRALFHFGRAMRQFESLGEVSEAARLHGNLGLTLTRLGRYSEGLTELELALQAFQGLGNANDAAR